MRVVIKQRVKSAMQSGVAGAGDWILVPVREVGTTPDALMGWPMSQDTLKTIQLGFASVDEAVAYAESHGLIYTIARTGGRKHKAKSYAANFSASRKEAWSH